MFNVKHQNYPGVKDTKFMKGSIMSKRNVGRGRPKIYKGNVVRHIVAVVRSTGNITRAIALLADEQPPIVISVPTVRKLVDSEIVAGNITVSRGRPVGSVKLVA